MLKVEPKNVKALYRRALGRSGFGLINEAKEDLEAVLKVDPENKAAKIELARVEKLIVIHDNKAKKSLHSFFTKGGLYDEKPGVVDTAFKEDDPTVYFDLKQGDEDLGRVEVRLYSHIVVSDSESKE